MPGQQLRSTNEGAENERLADLLLSKICAPTKVPREQDYGLDFYCTITQPEGHVVRTSPYSFGLQVKPRSTTNVISYGGYGKATDTSTWKAYEIEWLFTQSLPFLIGLVSQDTLDLYLTSGMWQARWEGGRPFRVDLTADAPNPVTQAGLVPVGMPVADAPGDGKRWTIPMGPPIVSWSVAEAASETHLATVRQVLARALDVEKTNVMTHVQGVPYREWILNWSPNWLPAPTETHLGTMWFGNSGEGMNLERCARALGISLPALALNLQAQGKMQELARLREAIHCVNDIRPIPDGIRAKITEILRK